MAIDPNQIAADQNQLAALASQGMPTEFAEDPANSVKVAGSGYAAMKAVLNRLDPKVNTPREVVVTPPGGAAVAADDTVGSVDPEVITTLPSRVPTAMELRTVPNAGQYNETATKAMLAPEVLSPAGQAKFKAQGYKNVMDQPPEVDAIATAQEALDEMGADTETASSSATIAALAKKAVTADDRGFNPEIAVVSDEVAEAILARTALKDENIRSLANGTGDFNFAFLETSDDVQNVINAVGDQFADEQTLIKRGIVTNNVTLNEAAGIMADEVGLTRELLNRRIGDGALSAAKFVAGRELLVKSAKELGALTDIINKGEATAADRLRFRRQLAIHSGIQLQLKGAKTEAARALQSFQIKVDGEMDLSRFNEEAKLMLAEGGQSDITDQMAAKLADILKKNPALKAINVFAEKSRTAKTIDAVSEAYLAGLLSSPATQSKNILGTAAFMAYQLPAEMISGMYGSAFRTKQKILGEGYEIEPEQIYATDMLLRFKGWLDSFSDATKAASIAFKTEIPSGGKSRLDVDDYTAIEGNPDSPLGSIYANAISGLGKRVRIGFRLLLAGDEFFKTISQRGELYTQANQAFYAALRNGATETEAQDAAGMVLLDPRSVGEKLDTKSRYDTMQSDLGEFGRVTSTFQRIPIIGKIVLPFATAPTNSALRTAEFTFINYRVWKDFVGKNGQKAQQLATGRMALGGATAAIVAKKCLDGDITGALPSDPVLREAMIKAKKKPYSLTFRQEPWPSDESGEPLPKFDKYGIPNGPLRYVSYDGFEPVSAIIGLTCNVTQLGMNNPNADWFEKYAAGSVFATADYYKELPMIQGLVDVISTGESIANPETSLDLSKLLRGPAEAALPFVGLPSPVSSLQRGIARVQDPTGVRPRAELEYWTEEEIYEKKIDDDGNAVFVHALRNGKPMTNKIGTAKDSGWDWVWDLTNKLDALQSKDSVFGDEREKNAIVYDTLGNAYNETDFSLMNNAKMAIFSNVTGFKVSDSDNPKPYEKELIRIAMDTDTWPLSNPKEMMGIKLSFGAQSDLANIAKNEIVISKFRLGPVTFREALEFMLTEEVRSNPYSNPRTKDAAKVSLIRALNKEYIDAAFEQMRGMPEYAKINQAVTEFKNREEN